MTPPRPAGAAGTLARYAGSAGWRLVGVLTLVVVVVLVDLAQPWLIKEAIDRHLAVATPDPGALLRMASAYLGLTAGAFGLTWLQDQLLQRSGQAIVRSIRVDLFRHVQGLSARYFDHTSAGRIITNVVNDTEALSEFFTQFMANTMRSVVSLALITVLMLRLDAGMALRCFIMIPVVAVVSLLFRRVLRRVYGETRSRLASVIAFLAENLSGMAIVQIFHQEAKQARRFDERNAALLEATVRENRTSLTFNHTTELLGDVGVAALVWFGGGAVVSGAVSFGILYAFIGYIRRFFQPINTITQQLNVLQSALIAAERIGRTFQERAEIAERPGARAPAPRGEVRFEAVSLEYTPGRPVLREISLTIPPGGRVGFVGSSGAGKSSLMNLVTRAYDVTRGGVVVDGEDVRDWPLEPLRRAIGVVQQEVTLFSGTIVDNIRFFRDEIPDERVREACRLVGAEPFILRQPAGYATPLSERGSTLSAGERQLLSFARVLVFDPRILILDEATASLDSESEAVLQAAIGRVARGRTLLVIAHRLSTVEDMDLIVVLDQGRIVEVGPPAELLRRQGRYWQLRQSGTILDKAG